MTQAQFMYELMVAAESFPDDKKLAIMNDCDRYFADRKSTGASEEEITKSLPSPSETAVSFCSGKNYPFAGVTLADEASDSATALGVFLFILLIPVCAVHETLVFVLGLAASAALLILCVAAAFLSVACFGISGLSRGFILIGIGGLFVTVALVLFSVAVFKGIAAAFAWFPRFMGRVKRFRKGAKAA